MDFSELDKMMRFARAQVGISEQVRAEKASGVPCECCGIRTRPFFFLAVAQAVAQRIFLLHLDEHGCDWTRCDEALSYVRQLPADYRMDLK